MFLHKMNQYFPKPFERFGRNVKFELDFSNYATKDDLKGAPEVYTSNLAAKSDLASLKVKMDEIDVKKLKNIPVDLTKLNNVVNNDVIKKNLYDKLVIKVNAIDTGVFVLKTQYDTDKSGLEKKINDADKKISDTSGLVKKTDYNAKISGIEGKIPSTAGLATTAALPAVENKIPSISNLAKK